jgi:hypothetical protein
MDLPQKLRVTVNVKQHVQPASVFNFAAVRRGYRSPQHPTGTSPEAASKRQTGTGPHRRSYAELTGLAYSPDVVPPHVSRAVSELFQSVP